MSNFASSKSVILPNVTLDFFDAWRPGKPARDGGKAKFKAKVIVEPNSPAFEAAKAALLEAATALWGDNARNVLPSIPANNKALRNGNSNLDQSGNIRPEYKDKYFLSCSNDTAPQVVAHRRHPDLKDSKGNPAFIDIQEDGSVKCNGQVINPPFKITKPYRGCKVNLKVTFVAGKSFKAGSGEVIPNQVYAKFEALQFAGDGTPFGSGPTSAEGFEDADYDGGSAGGAGNLMDDDIPF